MDNRVRFYDAQFNEACELADQGLNDGALQICFKVRLCNDVSHYRRATIYLLIAAIADRKIYDNMKFAREALNIREQSVNGGTDDSTLLMLEETARNMIQAIAKDLAADVLANDAANKTTDSQGVDDDKRSNEGDHREDNENEGDGPEDNEDKADYAEDSYYEGLFVIERQDRPSEYMYGSLKKWISRGMCNVTPTGSQARDASM